MLWYNVTVWFVTACKSSISSSTTHQRPMKPFNALTTVASSSIEYILSMFHGSNKWMWHSPFLYCLNHYLIFTNTSTKYYICMLIHVKIMVNPSEFILVVVVLTYIALCRFQKLIGLGMSLVLLSQVMLWYMFFIKYLFQWWSLVTSGDVKRFLRAYFFSETYEVQTLF